MSTQVQYRRGTTGQNDAFTGALAEITVDTTTNTLRVHDGITAGGFPVVGTTQVQTLTNKTLTSPLISSPSVTGTITGNLIPAANVTYNLGNSTAYWNDLYLAGNTIYLGTLQLKDTGAGALGVFQSDGTTRANVALSEIVYGNTTFAITSAGGNAIFSINGVNSVLAVTPLGIDVEGDAEITGDIDVNGNLTVAHVESVDTITASGNVSANYFIGNGSQLTGIDATAIQNGTANVRTFLNGNVAITAAGTANVVVVTASGTNVAGTLDATGNITGGNITTAGLVSAGTLDATGNITGGNITTAGLVSAGTLDVTGNITGGNLSGTNISGTLTTAAQTNITSLGTLTSLTVNGLTTHTGNVDITGNVNVTGNLNYQDVTNLVVGDPLIFLGANNTGNLYDLGFSATYNDGTAKHTGLARNHLDGTWTFFDGVNEPTTVVDFANATFPAVKTGAFTSTSTVTATGNITGANLLSNGIINAVGNVTANYFIGNGSQLTGIDATAIQNGTANVRTFLNGNVTVSAAGTANVVVVTDSGTNVAGTLDATGNITGGNLSVTTGTITLGNVVNGGSNGVGNIGSSTTYFNTVFAKATSAQYADLAEMYVSDADYLPGTVVVFGGPYEVSASAIDGDIRVAGVVSTNPSYLMNATCHGQHVVPVAMVGRVPTWVTGPVRKGDMMIASANGRARSSVSPALGSVIGKALEDFDGDMGIIEVVVGRL